MSAVKDVKHLVEKDHTAVVKKPISVIQKPTAVVRIRRKNNHVLQDCEVYIGRQVNQGGWILPQSKWHNPYKVGVDGTREQVIAKFEKYLLGNEKLMKSLPELKGKILGCWCKPKACHGDVLAKYANSISGYYW
jgi:hypothetical protein